MEALAVRKVHSEELTQRGEYVFVAKRPPIRNVEKVPVDPPAGFFARLVWRSFGAKYTLKETLEPIWPDIDTIIINCPVCNGPCGTTKNHEISSVGVPFGADAFVTAASTTINP
jgi:hypothetical protein